MHVTDNGKNRPEAGNGLPGGFWNWIKEIPVRLAWKLGTSPYGVLFPIALLLIGMLTLFFYPQVFAKPLIVDLHLPSEEAIPKAIPSDMIDEDEDDPRWLFRYGTTGTELRSGVPYWIFRVMPKIFGDEFKGRGYDRFGFFPDNQDFYRWRPLPRGLVLADSTLHLPFLKVSAKVKRVAINCSGCHQGEYLDQSGNSVLVDGMPNHTGDLQEFKRFFGWAFQEKRFTAKTVIKEINRTLIEEENKPPLNSLEEAFYISVVSLLKQATRERTGAWMDSRANNGPGRIDPFNAVKIEVLKAPDDGTAATLDFPSVWNQGKEIRKWHHYDGNTKDSSARNFGSTIGVGGISLSVNKKDVNKVGDWLDILPSPRYPFVKANLERVERGLATFKVQCAKCHGLYDRNSQRVTEVPNSKYMTTVRVGTDPERWKGFPMWAAAALNDFGERRQLWPRDAFRPATEESYLCGPLDGIWARAPYLHNGSVPTIAELLKPSEERVKSFYRGSRRYNEEQMGWVYKEPTEGIRELFEYRTVEDPAADGSPPIPGNSNVGHPYTVKADEVADLIEYLKTL